MSEYEHTRQAAGVFDLSPRGKVEVTGAEAASFLHNLCTNDIRNLPLGAGCEFFLTTNKAKVVAHGYAYHLRLQDGSPAFWLDLPPGQAEPVIKHLEHFLISEQVEFADRTVECAQLYLAGPAATTVLAKALAAEVPSLAELQHMVCTFGTSASASVRRHDALGLAGYEIVCLRDCAATVREILLQSVARPAGEQTYEILRVEAGTPEFSRDIDENTFAPEVGRATQAICYTKGCYLGQEPIVMARDRGQVNRTLLGLRLTGATVPLGSLLYHEGKEVGRTMSSVISPRLGPIALAYVRRGSQEPGTELEVAAGGERRPAVVVELPFPA